MDKIRKFVSGWGKCSVCGDEFRTSRAKICQECLKLKSKKTVRNRKAAISVW